MNASFTREELGNVSAAFMDSLLNWTFPGAALYYRDAELEENILSKYEVGQIIRSQTFVDVSGFAGKPTKNCRFIIASSKAAPFYALKPVYPKTERWRLHVINANSYFKVQDIYRKDGITQIFLLHIPAKGIEVFRHSVFNFGDGDVEKQFIEKARASLDKRLEMLPAPELEEKDWIDRTKSPLGLDMNNQFFPLEPEADIWSVPDVAGLYSVLFAMTEDNELNIFPESNNN
ncbi:MAG: hypothetical protein LBT24_03320, partial [Tannerella sp.]|jgi:hypothetical protein|nr:hypothetical protein [Tannerella sp.]